MHHGFLPHISKLRRSAFGAISRPPSESEMWGFEILTCFWPKVRANMLISTSGTKTKLLTKNQPNHRITSSNFIYSYIQCLQNARNVEDGHLLNLVLQLSSISVLLGSSKFPHDLFLCIHHSGIACHPQVDHMTANCCNGKVVWSVTSIQNPNIFKHLKFN